MKWPESRSLELAIKKLIRLELDKAIRLVQEEIKTSLNIENTVKKIIKEEKEKEDNEETIE
jgi:hypothetical protein